MYPLTSVPVLSDIFAALLSSIVVLTTDSNFWDVPLLHSVSDITYHVQNWQVARVPPLYHCVTFRISIVTACLSSPTYAHSI